MHPNQAVECPCPFGGNAKILVTQQSYSHANSSDSVKISGVNSRVGGRNQLLSSGGKGEAEGESSSHVDAGTYTVGTCQLAHAIPGRYCFFKSIGPTLQERQKNLAEAGCPKWKLEQKKFLFIEWLVGKECDFANGGPHPYSL